MSDPWFIEIERMDMDFEDMESIVIGPFEEEAAAENHMNFSIDVEDWLTGEAKAKNYIAHECYLTQHPSKPSYGVNRPVPDDDETQWIPLGGKKD